LLWRSRPAGSCGSNFGTGMAIESGGIASAIKPARLGSVKAMHWQPGPGLSNLTRSDERQDKTGRFRSPLSPEDPMVADAKAKSLGRQTSQGQIWLTA
jgi:hypothetical protein